MSPNFFRYLLTSWIRDREEGLEFGLTELEQLFPPKRNNGFQGTMILVPARVVPSSVINLASVGDFDFTWIPREWSELFGRAPMTPELRGLITALRRGSPRWLSFNP
ncbi:Uncharacterized protein Rs2_34616 [Raphanus sativus]|nr:Uncharacterized protein Rs2_34616 [Raphanus sativus]